MDTAKNQNSVKSIVILYTELAGYTIKCIETLATTHQVNIHVFNYPVNREAPFEFDKSHSLITYYNKNEYNAFAIAQVIEKVKPSLIYCAGWGDKDYLHVIRTNKKKIPTLLGFDNNWTGSLKQRLAAIYARINLTPYFNYAFVPGAQQKIFAQKMGFDNNHIIEGAYSADTVFFNQVYLDYLADKSKKMPHRFIYVGRYAAEKGIEDLWKAFAAIPETVIGDWELWCLGTGNIAPLQHPRIKHFGFVQPAELITYIKQTGIFILPSHFEPWGVVVHEYAAAGFPLMLSNEVGAKNRFLTEGKNGYSFSPANSDAIQQAMEKMIGKTDHELLEMGEASHRIAQCITPKTWATSIFNLLS